jgi:hypothetical protein
MAASTITRVTWTDGPSGTVVNNARKNSDIYDKVDEMFAGAGTYATFTLGGKLRVEGAGITVKGTSAPSVSAASEGAIYFDSTRQQFLKSENAQNFVPLGLSAYQDPIWLCGLHDNSGAM